MKSNIFGKVLILLFSILLCMPQMAAAESSELKSTSKAYEARNGVVRIIAMGTNNAVSIGSGFGVGKAGEKTNIFVTNKHVVTDNNGNLSDEVYILLDNDAATYNSYGTLDLHTDHMVRCKILGHPVDFPDFAILEAVEKVDGRVALPLWSSDNVEPLDNVVALGYPGTADELNGMKYLYADVDSVNTTNGSVNRITEISSYGNTKCIVHDCEINHGNSGGPLLTTEGAVVGINTYGITLNDSGLESTFNSSVCIDYVMDELDRLDIDYDVYTPGSSEEPAKVEEKSQSPVKRILIIGAIIVLGLCVFGSMLSSQESKNARHDAEMKRHEDEMKRHDAEMKRMKEEVEKAVGKLKAIEESDPKPKKKGFRLQGISGYYARKRFALEGKVVMGVDASHCNLPYPKGSAGISRRHLELKVNGNHVFLKDLGSTYGTYCNDRKLEPQQWIRLKVGDRFWLASERECFALDETK